MTVTNRRWQKYIFLTLGLLGCASGQVASDSKVQPTDIKFANIENLISEKVSSEQILNRFGPPKEKSNDKDVIQWIYLDQRGLPHLTIKFNGNGQVINVLWQPLDSETEASMNGIMSHFPGLKFNTKELFPAPLDAPDSSVNVYTSQDNLVSFVVGEARRDVQAVVFWSNNSELKRSPTSN